MYMNPLIWDLSISYPAKPYESQALSWDLITPLHWGPQYRNMKSKPSVGTLLFHTQIYMYMKALI